VRLDRDHRLTARERAHLDTVLADATRLLETVSDLHDFSAIDMGLLQVEQTLVDVRDLLQQAVLAFADHPQLTRTPIELVVPESTAPLLTDPSRLREVVTHLIANALDHTGDGWVCVTLQADESDGTPVAILVDDSGVGIAAERQLSLFAPFDRIPSTAAIDQRHPGTGLGLARARALAESIGCTLSLAWSEAGAGASFSLALPLASRAARLAGVYPPRPTTDVDLV
jgi:signal transduction histidine kinase